MNSYNLGESKQDKWITSREWFERAASSKTSSIRSTSFQITPVITNLKKFLNWFNNYPCFLLTIEI